MNTRMVFPLVVRDIEEKIDRDDAVIECFPVTWDRRFNDDFRDAVRVSIQRGMEEIRKSHKKLSEAGLDITFTLKHISTSNVHLRGDYRYPSDEMADWLERTNLDLVPILVGKSKAGMHLLDGHHRWRAYVQAHKKPLVLIIEIKPSEFQQPSIIVQF